MSGSIRPAQKYVLCCPQQGFNDQMNQLWHCYSYAKRSGRILLVDTQKGSLKRVFSDVFDVTRSKRRIRDISTMDASALDRLTTHPPSLQGKVSTYEIAFIQHLDGSKQRFRRALKGSDDVLDLKIDDQGQKRRMDEVPQFSQDLVLHAAGGGGNKGKRFLEMLALKPHLANAVLDVLCTLPKNLVACHIRQTDMQIDAAAFLSCLNTHIKGQPILVCSDDFAVREKAQTILHNAAEVIFASDLPDLAGARLHDHPDYWEKDRALISLFIDLFAMAGARDLVFPFAFEPNRDAYRFSGFAVLADNLRLDVHAQRSILSRGDRDLRRRYFRHGPPSQRRHSKLATAMASQYPEMAKLKFRRKRERHHLANPVRRPRQLFTLNLL